MTMARNFKRSPLALAILTLLHEAPMHPYRMQRLIRDRGKDQVINVGQRASLYQTINQLVKAKMIATREMERQEGFPERTVYELTEQGHTTAVAWMREMLSAPAQEFPEFPAAVSFLPLLTPDDAIRQLKLREAKLADKLEQIEKELKSIVNVQRLFLLESEYMRTLLKAEIKWVRGVIADVQSGELTWNQDRMQPLAPPQA